jgi:hypothetical protein
MSEANGDLRNVRYEKRMLTLAEPTLTASE